MAQLYTQRAVAPDSWDMSGAPATTVICLSVDATINYSDGSADTLPANTPAVLSGGGTSFDRTHDVYVPYTVQGSGVLSIIKESLLPTLTSAYAPLARVELHGIKPYQPEPYLASGGLGTPTSSGTYAASGVATRCKSLWNGSSNNAPASGWETSGFAETGWVAAVPAYDETLGLVPISGTRIIWSSYHGLAPTEQTLFRHHFTLPAGTITAATLQITFDANDLGLFVNGHSLGTPPNGALWAYPSQPDAATAAATVSIPPTDLTAGGANVLAVWVSNEGTDTDGALDFTLSVTYAGTGSTVATAGTPAEGDLLIYHSGAWTDLPIGTSGQELTVVSGDPAWATPAAGYTDPLTTKGDVLTRTSSATVRLGVGSNGQVPTADSTQASGIRWATPSASGVTSIDVAVPAPLSATGGPITSSGTVTLSWASGQTANRVLASPNGTTGAVSLRALVAADIPNLPASQITSAQLATARGGTGVDGSAATNGQLLIGNGSGYTLATITAGSGVTVTNGSGTVTIAASGGSGTVTSVALTVPGFLSVSGSPITTSGTLAVTLATQSAGTVFAGPAAGSSAAPTFRALAASDLPPAAAAGGHIHAHGHFL